MSKRILIQGNEAMVEGAIAAGVDAYFGYPITPQNEVTAHMAKRMPEEGRVFVQCESELAAINMVFGAAATGKRAMTTSSSPGISLMQEGMSYLAGAQLPAVVVNVMRGGPGLGNIAPSQGDYYQATRGGGHGDYRTIVLAPSSVQEIYDFMPLTFELAEKYRMTVLMLADGILGQMMEPLKVGGLKPAPACDKPWALTGAKGRKSQIVRSLMLAEGALEEFNFKLQAKYRIIEAEEIRCEQLQTDDAELVVVAYGIVARMVRAAIQKARDKGIKVGLVRPITLWPFPMDVLNKLAGTAERFLTIEMSCGQMVDDVKLAANGQVPVEFYGRPGGGVPTVDELYEQIESAMCSNTR